MHGDDGDCPKGAEGVRACTRESALCAGWTGAVALVLASSPPEEMPLAAFTALLLLGALVVGVCAAISCDRVTAPHVTRWNETAELLGMGTVAGLLVDAAGLEHALQRGRVRAPVGFGG